MGASIVLNLENSKNLNFDDKTVSNIPTISEATIKLLLNDPNVTFEKQQKESLSYHLLSKVHSLVLSKERYQKAVSRETKDKIYSVIKAALYVGFIAGAVLAILTYGSNPLVGVAIFFPCSIVAAIAAKYLSGNACSGWGGLLIEMICAPGLTIYNACTNVSKLKQRLDFKKKEVEIHFNNNHKFFLQNFDKFKDNMNKRIQNCEVYLQNVKDISSIQEDSNTQIENQKIECEKAIREITDSVNYFSKLNDQST